MMAAVMIVIIVMHSVVWSIIISKADAAIDQASAQHTGR
jgi:hypothetical protein